VAGPPEIHVRVPRVFCGPGGEYGNELGVVLDGSTVPSEDRQALARHLAYAETVFVDDPERGRIQINTPEVELPFAGHPSVGTAWLLAQEGYEIDALRPPAGEVAVRRDGEVTWVAARPEWCPAWELRQLGSPEEVDAHPVATRGELYVWAWLDEGAGIVRARCFVPELGVMEDEATGSAALPLAAQLGREIEVRQGKGSVIHARPIGEGLVEIGGLCVED
jgi:predicted PhzF superfamily epimerase YddE/YHI9